MKFLTVDQDTLDGMARRAIERDAVDMSSRVYDARGHLWTPHAMPGALDGGGVVWAEAESNPHLRDVLALSELVDVHGPIGFATRRRGDKAATWTFVLLDDGTLDTRLFDELDPMELDR